MSSTVTSVFTFKVESTFDEWAAIFDSAEATEKHREFNIQPLYRGCSNDDPKKIIENIRSSKCFVIGGGIVNSRFVDFLTHIYVTPHPHIFGKGVSLFSNQVEELKLKFIKIVEHDIANGIIQYQYEIIR